MKIQSKHKEIVGRANGIPYHVKFDADGLAEVDEAVGEQLLRLNAASRVDEPAGADGGAGSGGSGDGNSGDPAGANGTAGTDGGTVDLSAMTVVELRAYAKDRNITLGTARSKDDILTAIKEAVGE